MASVIHRTFAAISSPVHAACNWIAHVAPREQTFADPTALDLARQVAELHELVHNYEDVLDIVSRRLGLQTRTMIESGKVLGLSGDGKPVELKSELARRLSEILTKNQELQQELSTARDELRVKHLELDQAKAESRIDHLTQLPNRRAFEERITELQAGFERYGTQYSLAIFDVDHFKFFNDSHGHAAGDAMLRTISKAVEGMRRATDFLARTGGEEFAILFPRTNLAQCKIAVERYRRTIAATKLKIGGERLMITASFGAAAILRDETVSQFMARADEALYAAKQAGRDQICMHAGDCVEALAEACPTA